MGRPLMCQNSRDVSEVELIRRVDPLPPQLGPNLLWAYSMNVKQSDRRESKALNGNVWSVDDIVYSFGPSRIPSLIALRLERARAPLTIGEIDDLLNPYLTGKSHRRRLKYIWPIRNSAESIDRIRR